MRPHAVVLHWEFLLKMRNRAQQTRYSPAHRVQTGSHWLGAVTQTCTTEQASTRCGRPPPRSHGQRRICSGSCSEEDVVPSVYKYRAEVEFFYVEESCQSGTIKGLVPQPFAQNRTAE